MKPSTFSFTDPILRSLNFQVNRKFTPKEDNSIPVIFHTKINENKGKFEAIVELTVKIGSDEDSFPFCIEAVEGARFTWDKSIEDKKDNLLRHNAPALLLGYLRPMIATVTAASPFNAYTIPFIDFTSENDPPEKGQELQK